MPPKKQLPAPIDRPLARAYLREFSGWSTAFPPGVSEPTSLRIMENAMVNRDGSLRIRPGLRYLSYHNTLALDAGLTMVGTHEVFFLNNGDKAYLFAVREVDGTVGFRVARYTEGKPGFTRPYQILPLTDPLVGFDVPAGGVNFSSATTYVKYLQLDNKIVALSDAGETIRIFQVGTTKSVAKPVAIARPNWTVGDKARLAHPTQASILDPVTYPPINNFAARTARTLLPPQADWDSVPNNVAYFYTFSNEVGESAASQLRVMKLRRPWAAWQWMEPNAASEPSTTDTEDPARVADQLFVYPTESAFNAAVAAGARTFNVYAMMWSDQDPVPVDGILVGTRNLTSGLAYVDCWVRHSPAPFDGSRTAPSPTASNRRDYSDPAKAGQGLVAADRMVLVRDPNAAAVIKWTSNEMGEYTNFTSSRGGGYKTLTYGNLYIPACVKLWQNPESKDTLTILCQGVDGYSSSFYMAPAQVASQSEATNIMGFEETTATPGTTSPYGCEVLNNALYHPLETELMKSTASNYNINHKPMTEQIANMWAGLLTKENIVSSQHDNRLYYVVNNRDGEPLEAGCWGNEVWVCDVGSDSPTWSRWLVQSQSLRKIEIDGRVVMSVVRPDGIYCFDPALTVDEYVDAATREVLSRPIPWRIETNTQGANRAHDAWAHLQQVTLTLGNFSGDIRWGVRGADLHGKLLEFAKQVEDKRPGPADGLPFDLDDHLQVRRDLKEWVFFAESVTDGAGATLPSAGQLSLVQYRYAPVSVNVGYEYGSIETFEYARNQAVGNNSLYTNGVPVPMVDTSRP